MALTVVPWHIVNGALLFLCAALGLNILSKLLCKGVRAHLGLYLVSGPSGLQQTPGSKDQQQPESPFVSTLRPLAQPRMLSSVWQ